MIGNRSFRVIVIALFVLGVFLHAGKAYADGFYPVTPGNIVKAFIRYGALDIRDNNVVNDYIQTNECKIYNYFQKDDFKWHEVQEAARKAIKQDVEIYPTAFDYDATMQLDRYDFDSKFFRFKSGGDTAINTFRLNLSDYEICGQAQLKTLPNNVSFVLDRSIQFLGIPLEEEQAKELLRLMEKNNNANRLVYARFKIKIVYIQPILKTEANQWGKEEYKQGTSSMMARIDSRLETVEFYQDKARTKLIIKYAP